jgi:hypothetical protein
MTSSKNWIEVDRAGLAQVIADRPKSFILFELIQNALDEDGVTEIDVAIAMHDHKRGRALIVCRDNSSNGYHDIRHAWTLYAPSKKKGDAEKRGRFNVGCKMVLALAVEASVVSMESAVRFSVEDGRRNSRERTKQGTEFSGMFRMSKTDVADAIVEARRLLPPLGVTIRINNVMISGRVPFQQIHGVKLATLRADDEGILRGTSRQTTVELFEPLYTDSETKEVPTLYEMGIPVVELDGDDPWHVNVLQRVPLNIDRDNVTPAYLRTIRVVVLNAAHDKLDEEQARSTWATEASEDDRAEPEAVEEILTHRFGEKRVSFDPSDPEANKLAASKGYTVVPGGSLTKGQWRNSRDAGAILPAGQVTPSPTVKFSLTDGVPPIPSKDWTRTMHEIGEFARSLAWTLPGIPAIAVTWYGDSGLGFAAAWGEGGRLSMNKASLSYQMLAWRNGDRKPVLEILIHEFAHEASGDHLSSDYYDELCRIGAALYFSEEKR